MKTLARWSLLFCLAGCGAGTGTIAGVGSSTTNAQVLNASTVAIDVVKSQAAIDPNLAFGTAGQCHTVEPISHGLSVRGSASLGINGTAFPLPSFAGNERYIVPVTGTATALSLLSIRNSFTPVTGDGGVRLINVGGAGAFDMYVTAPGATLTTADVSNVATGAASSYVNIPAGTKQIRLTTNGSTQVALDVGNVTIVDGGRTMVVLAPAAAGGTVLRPFVFQLAPNSGSC